MAASSKAKNGQDGRIPRSPGLKLPPERSILKLKAGDNIQLGQGAIVRLAEAFFAEIKNWYS